MSASAESSEVIEIALEEAFQQRPVNTKIHEPYLIGRLIEHPARVENTLEYQAYLHDVGGSGTRLITVRWTWTHESIPPTPLAAQQEYITEAAAYGMAFAIVRRLTAAELLDTALRGDRFDYVLVENGARCGIEISGSQTTDRQALRDRHQQKIRQLLENRMGWGGYVVVAGFARREVIVSYHAREGDRQR